MGRVGVVYCPVACKCCAELLQVRNKIMAGCGRVAWAGGSGGGHRPGQIKKRAAIPLLKGGWSGAGDACEARSKRSRHEPAGAMPRAPGMGPDAIRGRPFPTSQIAEG